MHFAKINPLLNFAKCHKTHLITTFRYYIYLWRAVILHFLHNYTAFFCVCFFTPPFCFCWRFAILRCNCAPNARQTRKEMRCLLESLETGRIDSPLRRAFFKRCIFWFRRCFLQAWCASLPVQVAVACSHEVKSKISRRFHRANLFYMIAMTLENTDKCSNVIAALAKCKPVNKKLTMRC